MASEHTDKGQQHTKWVRKKLAVDCSFWWKAVKNGMRDFKQNCVAYEKLKRVSISMLISLKKDATKFDLICYECDCICLSRSGLKNNQRCHMQGEIVITCENVFM